MTKTPNQCQRHMGQLAWGAWDRVIVDRALAKDWDVT